MVINKMFCIIACISAQLTIAQVFTTEKSLLKGQIGFFGMYFNHEAQLFNPFVMKRELRMYFFSQTL